MKIKGAKIISHMKSPTFRAAKLKGFTVCLATRYYYFYFCLCYYYCCYY